jgi:hypothetical protein
MKNVIIVFILSCVFSCSTMKNNSNNGRKTASEMTENVPEQCVFAKRVEAYIQSYKTPDKVVYIFEKSARDLYLKIDAPEKYVTTDNITYLEKRLGHRISCDRFDNLEDGQLSCASFQCTITVDGL